MQMSTVLGKTIHGEEVTLEVERLKWRPSAYALIFNQAGQVLVMDNTINGKYDLVGGGIEIWETAEEALVREAVEETGLAIRVDTFLHLSQQFFLTPTYKSHWHVISLFYRATVLSGDLRSTLFEDEPSVNPHWIDPYSLTKNNLTIEAAWDALAKALAS